MALRLRDRRALIAIERRLARIERDGYFGDHKYLRDGVSELRIDEGAGYRVYYAQLEQVIVLLLCGGTSRRKTRISIGQWPIGKNFSGDEKRARYEQQTHAIA